MWGAETTASRVNDAMTPRTVPTDDRSPALHRRAFLIGAGVAGLTFSAGCLQGPSSGGPDYGSREIDDGPLFGPGLQDETDRDYYAALVVTEAHVDGFDLDRLSDVEAAFVNDTDFRTAYLGVIQVSALNSSTRFELVDVHESSVNLTVVIAVRDDTPHSDDRVITTLLLRVDRDGGGVPDTIAVELDVGEHHETFSGSQLES